jgi:hypothetical protein
MALSALSADPRAAGHGDCIVGMTCRDEARLMRGGQSESRMERRHEVLSHRESLHCGSMSLEISGSSHEDFYLASKMNAQSLLQLTLNFQMQARSFELHVMMI